MWPRGMGKIIYAFVHSFTFPQDVEKKVENQKKLDAAAFSRCGKTLAFSTRKRKNPRAASSSPPFFSIRFYAVLFFPHFLSHFSLFHRASFQEFPQRADCLFFSTKLHKFLTPHSPEKAKLPHLKNTGCNRLFSSFQFFHTNYHHYI